MKSFYSTESIISWNRKFHIYIGLFLFSFILFFSLSGLLLNHGEWKFASFWKERKESEIAATVTIPVGIDSSAFPEYFIKQLNISGEVSNVKLTSSTISFRVTRPGTNADIDVDFKTGICKRKEMVFNFWGKMRTLHTFNGSDKVNVDLRPNWILTNLWRLIMDSIAIGLILLCISSWVMWYKIRQNYSFGLIVFIAGIAGAILFIVL